MSPLLTFTTGRDETLGLNLESTAKRVEKNRETGLKEEIEKMATVVAEGHSMSEGTNFVSGLHLAQYTNTVMEFVVAALQERGLIAKKVLKKGQKSGEDKSSGYL